MEDDNRNLGFHVNGPEAYLSVDDAEEIDRFMGANAHFQLFYDSVGVYFDAKSHYADEIDSVSIELVRERILRQAAEIEKKKIYNCRFDTLDHVISGLQPDAFDHLLRSWSSSFGENRLRLHRLT